MKTARESVWAPYAPSAAEPWNLRRVVHLHRRAAFGASWGELQLDLAAGPDAALERLLAGKRGAGVPADFEATSKLLVEGAMVTRNAARLKGWWLWRMLLTPDPLGERLALAWHNHFATSNVKVMDLAAMLRQNELFRRHARAPFGTLLRAVTHDAALLRWLDAHANRAEHPNENLARELMELFTLGEGHYGERDVQAAARALTGWSLTAEGRFFESAENHDDKEKTVLGRTGRWSGDELLGILLAEPAVAQRLARRLCELFLREELATPEVQDSLAGELRRRELDIGHGVALVLRSRLFFSEANLGGVVLGPAQFVIDAARALELFEPPPSTLLLAEWCARLGQDLFYPPNVFGWDGGRAWISTGTMLGRARFAAELAAGRLASPTTASQRTSPVEALAKAHALGDPGALQAFVARLFLGVDEAPLGSGDALERVPDDRARLLARFLSSPEAQLG